MKLRYLVRSPLIIAMTRRLESFRPDPAGKNREALAEIRGSMLLVIRIRWILMLFLSIYALYSGSLIICSRGVETIGAVMATGLAGAMLAAVALNLFYRLLYRELSHFPFANHIQVLLDIIITTAIIHYSGGIFSPFQPLYGVIALESTLLLERKQGVWAMCGASSLAFASLIASEHSGAVAPVPVPFADGALLGDLAYCLLAWSWVSTLVAAMGVIGMMVAGVVRRREGALKQLVVKDQMTNLYNRSHFFKSLNSEIQRSLRYNHVFSIIFLDIDDFKSFNDTFGHLEGDRVLRELARILRSKARRSETDPPYDIDVPCRYGGEEFTVILPETPVVTVGAVHGVSDGMNAMAFAERIRQEVASVSVDGAGITVSIGVAAFPQHGDTSEDLVRAADEALYRSKKQGKNRIVIAETASASQNGMSSSGLNVGSSYAWEPPKPGSSDTLPPA